MGLKIVIKKDTAGWRVAIKRTLLLENLRETMKIPRSEMLAAKTF